MLNESEFSPFWGPTSPLSPMAPMAFAATGREEVFYNSSLNTGELFGALPESEFSGSFDIEEEKGSFYEVPLPNLSISTDGTLLSEQIVENTTDLGEMLLDTGFDDSVYDQRERMYSTSSSTSSTISSPNAAFLLDTMHEEEVPNDCVPMHEGWPQNEQTVNSNGFEYGYSHIHGHGFQHQNALVECNQQIDYPCNQQALLMNAQHQAPIFMGHPGDFKGETVAQLPHTYQALNAAEIWPQFNGQSMQIGNTEIVEILDEGVQPDLPPSTIDTTIAFVARIENPKKKGKAGRPPKYAVKEKRQNETVSKARERETQRRSRIKKTEKIKAQRAASATASNALTPHRAHPGIRPFVSLLERHFATQAGNRKEETPSPRQKSSPYENDTERHAARNKSGCKSAKKFRDKAKIEEEAFCQILSYLGTMQALASELADTALKTALITAIGAIEKTTLSQ